MNLISRQRENWDAFVILSYFDWPRFDRSPAGKQRLFSVLLNCDDRRLCAFKFGREGLGYQGEHLNMCTHA